jgi:hypothetical protein
VSLPRSWFGGALAGLYLVIALWVAQDEVRHSHGGWINLRGMGTNILTAPSQLTLGAVLEGLGVPRINYNKPGVTGYGQLALHILVTAGLVYLVGWGAEWLVRRGLDRA